MFYALSLSSVLIATNYASQLSTQTLLRVEAAFNRNCDLHGKSNCHDVDNAFDYTTSVIEYIGWENTGSCCKYKYKAIHNDDNENCLLSGNQNPSLSHFGIDIFCPENGVAIVDAQSSPQPISYGYDGSTCTDRMLKFDQGFEKDDGWQFYSVCLTFNGFNAEADCRTATGWIQQKAGQAFDFEEIQVPELCGGTPVTPAPLPPPIPDTCVQQGSGLDIPHPCVCVDGDSCPSGSDGAFCNAIGLVRERIKQSASVVDDCGPGQSCCCNCPNCRPIGL